MWGAWKQDSGNVGCKVPEDHWETTEGSWMYSRAAGAGETFSIQGESQVCVEELTWRQV